MNEKTDILTNTKFLVTNIQRFSVNDGPGIRTTVFLKGCPLKCKWCHNPECINRYNELFHNTDKCARCGACIKICKEGAISFKKPANYTDGQNMNQEAISPPPVIDRVKCTRCMECVSVCKFNALTETAMMMSLSDVFDEIMSDEIFYHSSGGGCTISGGDPLFHPEITMALLQLCKEKSIHTALETSGFAKWQVIEPILNLVDLVLLDIKHIDDEKHKKWTGVSNALILENARKMAKKNVKIRLRLPIIHDVNYWDLSYPRGIVEFARELGESITGIDILPYHTLAESKIEQLGIKSFFKGFPDLSKDDVSDYERIIRDGGDWEVLTGGVMGVGK